MIIEGAFYKLPELLLGHDASAGPYEATLASHLAMAVLLELNARNVQMPQRRILVERPYLIEKRGPAARSDLYVDLGGVFPSEPRWLSYGFHDHNWIECKLYAEIGRTAGDVTKVGNIGSLARDLLRLCLFVNQETPEEGAHGRYFVAVFNREPRRYLAFQRQSRDGDRRWLQELFVPGQHHLEVGLQDEVKSLLEDVGTGFVRLAPTLNWTLDVDTQIFEPGTPDGNTAEELYWGYLVRITGFSVQLGTDQVTYRDDQPWSEEQAIEQRQLADRVLALMGSGS